MADVKWIKIVVDIFDDEKIKLIEHLPDGDSIIVCWFKLLCLAGKQNNFGILMLNERIAYTDEMLATVFRRPINTVRLALETFEQFGMVEIVNGAITIPNWGKHQNVEGIDKVREQTRDRVNKFRQKQKLLAGCNVTGNATVTECNATEEDIEIDIEQEKEKESLTDTNVSVCRTKDVRQITEAWNSLGLQQLRKVTSDSKRGGMLRARVNEYGTPAVLEAIENVRKSAFLKGQNNHGWVITFDWFVKPNNFVKVLEGNFDDKDIQPTQQPQKKRQYQTAAEYNAPKPTVSDAELWDRINAI